MGTVFLQHRGLHGFPFSQHVREIFPGIFLAWRRVSTQLNSTKALYAAFISLISLFRRCTAWQARTKMMKWRILWRRKGTSQYNFWDKDNQHILEKVRVDRGLMVGIEAVIGDGRRKEATGNEGGRRKKIKG
jgi:hypothetical protein